MSRVLPILFNTDMVLAILDDRKTATRRLVKGDIVLRPEMEHKVTFLPYKPRKNRGCDIKSIKYFTWESLVEHEAPYQPGDILYVRETWKKLYYVDPDGYTHYDQEMYFYAADGVPNISLVDPDGFEEDDQRIRWHPSIHMPKEAARIWLRVTDVRVERLQGMLHDGALKEGIHYCKCPDGFTWNTDTDINNCYVSPMGAMEALWNSTIKKADLAMYGWNANPWVWVIEFERCEKPESEADISRHIEECSLQKEYGAAGRDGNGACLGFGKPFDDEPIEQCKQCIAYTGLESEEEGDEQ